MRRLIFGIVIILSAYSFLLQSCKEDNLNVNNQSSYNGDVISPPVEGNVEIISVVGSQQNYFDENQVLAFTYGNEIHMMIYGNKREDARIFVQDADGNKVKTLHAGKIKPGKNEFSFHHDPLPLGIYDIYVCFDVFNDTILNVKINKSHLPKIDSNN